MIGKIYKALTPAYNFATKNPEFKSRPALVIGKVDNDYVILPVSRVTKKANLDPVYDIEVDPAKYPKLNLTAVSYVRTHKQTVVHKTFLADEIGDLKGDYEDLYLDVLDKREEFSNSITEQALN